MAASASEAESQPQESDEALNDEDPKKKKKSRSSSKDPKDSKSRSRNKSKSKSMPLDGSKRRSETDEKRRARSTSRSALEREKKKRSSSRKDSKRESKSRSRSRSNDKDERKGDDSKGEKETSKEKRKSRSRSKSTSRDHEKGDNRRKSRSRSKSKSQDGEEGDGKHRRRKMTSEEREKRSYVKSSSKQKKEKESSDGRKTSVLGSLTAFLEEGREATTAGDGDRSVDRSVYSSQSKYRRKRTQSHSGSASVFGGQVSSREEVRERRRSRSSSGLLTAGTDKSISERRKELRAERKNSSKGLTRSRSESRVRKSILRKSDDETDTRPTTPTALSHPSDRPPQTEEIKKPSRRSSLSNGADIPAGFPIAAVDKTATPATDHIEETGEMPLLESTAKIRLRRNQENLENSQSTIGSETSNIRLRRRKASLARPQRVEQKPTEDKTEDPEPTNDNSEEGEDASEKSEQPVTEKAETTGVGSDEIKESNLPGAGDEDGEQQQDLTITPKSAKKKKTKRRSSWWNLGLDKEEKDARREIEEEEEQKALAVLGDAYNLSPSQLSALKSELESKSILTPKKVVEEKPTSPKKKKGSKLMDKVKRLSLTGKKSKRKTQDKDSPKESTKNDSRGIEEDVSKEEMKENSKDVPFESSASKKSSEAATLDDMTTSDHLASMLGLEKASTHVQNAPKESDSFTNTNVMDSNGALLDILKLDTMEIDNVRTHVPAKTAQAAFDMMNSSMASLDPTVLGQVKSTKRISSIAEMYFEPTQEEGEEDLKDESTHPVEKSVQNTNFMSPKQSTPSIVTFDSAQLQTPTAAATGSAGVSPHSRGSLSPHSSIYSTASEGSLASVLKRKSGEPRIESPGKNKRVSWVELTLDNPESLLVKSADTDGGNKRETKASVDVVASVDDLADEDRVEEAIRSFHERDFKDNAPEAESTEKKPERRRKKGISLEAAFEKDKKEKKKTHADERTVGTTTTSNTNTSEATTKISNKSHPNEIEPSKQKPEALSESGHQESITIADLTETTKSGSSSSLSRSSSKRKKGGSRESSSSSLTKKDSGRGVRERSSSSLTRKESKVKSNENSSAVLTKKSNMEESRSSASAKKDNEETVNENSSSSLASGRRLRHPPRSSSARVKAGQSAARDRSRRSRSESMDRSTSSIGSRKAGNRINYVPRDSNADAGVARSVGSTSGRSQQSGRSHLSARSQLSTRSGGSLPSPLSNEATHEDGRPKLEKKLSLEVDAPNSARRRKTSYLNRRNLMREEKAKSQTARTSVLSSLDSFLDKMGEDDDASLAKDDGRSVHSDGPSKDRVRRQRLRRHSSDDRSVSSAPGMNRRHRMRSRTSEGDALRGGLSSKLKRLDVDF